MNIETFRKGADNIRILSASMVEKAKSGHPGGAMGGADFANVLYSKYLVYDPEDPMWIARDRFFLDPGHMSPMLYSVLCLCGKFTIDELKEFRQWNSVTPGHPEVNPLRGIENTSGPLGQGHTMAVGCAIAERFLVERFGDVIAHKTYAFISDGGIQEEISQGAARIAGYLGLNNLIMFYDSNRVQLSTDVNEVTSEDVAMRYKAFGWNVIVINGNDAIEISAAIEAAQKEESRPTIIIGNTIMGLGCVTPDNQNFEGKCSTHGQPLSASGASFEKTIENLGGNPQNPWVIFDDVAKMYAERKKQLSEIVTERKAKFATWEKENPEKASMLADFIADKLPEIDYAAISHKPNVATRTASADVLSVLGKEIKNMIVSSADLANSDKTEAFLKATGPLMPHDFKGGFLHAGVAELTMAVIMNGIVLHGAMRAACATFFVFSDYMKPAMRMSALMELPVKFVFSHDAFRVGEDGPTHQPIEQEAQLRLLEELRNLSGKPSMLVLRPADSAETTIAWKMAMENKTTPTSLILTRQNINDIPSASGNRYNDAMQMVKGAYVVKDSTNFDIVLIGNGSEVGPLIEAADILENKGIKCRVVSAPSIGLFMSQSVEYRQNIIPQGCKRFGLTAGLPSTLREIVGTDGYIYGLSHFGASAPYKVLDEKFGFTSQNIAKVIEDLYFKN